MSLSRNEILLLCTQKKSIGGYIQQLLALLNVDLKNAAKNF